MIDGRPQGEGRLYNEDVRKMKIAEVEKSVDGYAQYIGEFKDGERSGTGK